MELVNLTGCEITIGNVVIPSNGATVAPSLFYVGGPIDSVGGVELWERNTLHVQGLPREIEGTVYVVSEEVASLVGGTRDDTFFVSPNGERLVRRW